MKKSKITIREKVFHLLKSLPKETHKKQVETVVTELQCSKTYAISLVSEYRNLHKITKKYQPKEKIFKLFDEGLSAKEIHKIYGHPSLRTLYVYRLQWNKRYEKIERSDVMEALCLEAEERRITKDELISRLLTIIVEDDLFNAVLGKE